MAVERYCIAMQGVLQGVGFRPFVYRLAQERCLSGWIANNCQGVRIEVQGEALALQDFIERVKRDKPASAEIHQISIDTASVDNTAQGFSIDPSLSHNPRAQAPSAETSSTVITPDLAPCKHCLQDIFDPSNRRYLYPFTHCAHCGPRFSITERLPYDRANTSMKSFALCDACQHEYDDPQNRRFHAEPIACAECGPRLQLCDRSNQTISQHNNALDQAAQALLNGNIIALKSVGGFQLLVDATNPDAVSRLRERKQRSHKPLALLYPDIAAVEQHCHVSDVQRQQLMSPQRPIVLLTRINPPTDQSRSKQIPTIATGIAPNNPDLGVMLPCSPLHYLLLSILQRPIVATSGNIAGDPLCIDNDEAIARLKSIADFFLLHDRTIIRPIDDSVVRIINGHPMMLRRSRGYAPTTMHLPKLTHDTTGPPPLSGLLAVGGHLKNAFALSRHRQIIISQHIGDLDSKKAQENFDNRMSDLHHFYPLEPTAVIHDQHPNYASTTWAQSAGLKTLAVQHHKAHFFSCMAEHQHVGPAIGVSWDGSGYSPDGILRGGEFFSWDGHQQVDHLASLCPFPLPGGEQAIREPRRQAAGLLYAMAGEDAFNVAPSLRQHFSANEQHNIGKMLARQLNSPLSSSVGRLFDAVAALLDIATYNHFEGEAAMALEFAARGSTTREHFPFRLVLQADKTQHKQWLVDWKPMVMAIIKQLQESIAVADIAAAFHNTLAQVIMSVVQKYKDYPVFLSGGVFQNQRLSETVTALLHDNHRQVFSHQVIPPNDGGLALGQLYYAHCVGDNSLCV